MFKEPIFEYFLLMGLKNTYFFIEFYHGFFSRLLIAYGFRALVWIYF